MIATTFCLIMSILGLAGGLAIALITALITLNALRWALDDPETPKLKTTWLCALGLLGLLLLTSGLVGAGVIATLHATQSPATAYVTGALAAAIPWTGLLSLGLWQIRTNRLLKLHPDLEETIDGKKNVEPELA